MDETQRHLLNLRVIWTTFRVAVVSHPEHADASAERARVLLAQVRQRTSGHEVLAAIANVEAQIDGLDVSSGETAFL